MKRIFTRLRSLSQTRSRLHDPSYHRLHTTSNQDNDPSYSALVPRIISDVFAPDRRPVVDVDHRSGAASLGGLLKSGIGLLGVNVMASAAKHPRENPSVWVYVVGGVTADEAAAMKAIVAERSEGRCELVVGGTRLLGPREAVEAVLAEDPLSEEALML